MPIEVRAAVELAQFLADAPTPEQIIAFHPSEAATERFYLLIEKEHEGTLTDDERAELDRDIHLEYMVGLIKVEAHKRLALRAS